MNLAWATHEGGGQYRYGAGQMEAGRFRFEPPLGVFPEAEPRWRDPDPIVTAGMAVREHWRRHHEMPARVVVDQHFDPVPGPRPPAPADPKPAPVRSGRLRRPDLKSVSVAELARRQREPGNG